MKYAPQDARELLHAACNAVELLGEVERQTGAIYPERTALAIAAERAEPVHDGKRAKGSAFLFAPPRPEAVAGLVEAARSALALCQRIQAEDIAQAAEWDQLPYPEADRLELALIPFPEENHAI